MNSTVDAFAAKDRFPPEAVFPEPPPAHADRPPLRSTFALRGAAVMVLGGLLTGGVLAGALEIGASKDVAYTLEPVARSELAAASQSLSPADAAPLVAEAEACRMPLASVTVRGAAGRGALRIRSGAYTSPTIQLGPQASRVAVPYPAPYLAGRGRISIESAAGAVEVFLTPGRRIDAGTRTTVIDVRWRPEAPC